MDISMLSENQIREMLNLGEGKNSGIRRVRFQDVEEIELSGEVSDINFLDDVEISLQVELGDVKMSLREILDLEKDRIILVDKMAGESVSLYAESSWLASGEVVVINESFGMRIVSFKKGEVQEAK